MNISIESVRFSADKKLEERINNKVSKLSQFDSSIINAKVFLRVEKAHDFENKIAEIKLDIPKVELFAKKQSNSFEKSVDMAVEALRRQLHKLKDKNKK